MPAPVLVWIRHSTLPAGQAALIAEEALPFWTSKGWTTTTAPTILPTPTPPIVYQTISHPSIPGQAVKVPTTAVSYWISKGWS